AEEVTQQTLSASEMTLAVPSPPSAMSTMSIFASAKTSRRPVAIFSATSRAPSEPLNLSGAIRMRTRQVHRRNPFCHVERSRDISYRYLLQSKRFLDSARNHKEASQRHALLQLTLQNFTGQLRVGSSLGKLHDLSFEEIERRSVARLEIGSRLWVGCDDLIAECLDCTSVAQLLNPFFPDDIARSFAAREHFRENFLTLFTADFPAVD